ncbi:hypothetical protein EJ08DRAFT_646741 [Tothia fuscella]|uniref:Uncharacterized protein n=1 Tax=Tothia fuscella TaxID=1048955 RepID=A0A9P4NXP2_9PEZI|nr:hypothetical protein EJ08DRAFT_646741 [Tothia fuscella]
MAYQGNKRRAGEEALFQSENEIPETQKEVGEKPEESKEKRQKKEREEREKER